MVETLLGLLALMRNQIEMAGRIGVKAVTPNSANRDDWEAIKPDIRRDAVGLLRISPERLNNQEFREDSASAPACWERDGPGPSTW